jgi:ubiquinone biosynthesis monooxygenase Coq7
MRTLTVTDRLFSVIDQGLRVTLGASTGRSGRPQPEPAPAMDPPSPPRGSAAAGKSIALMRVNHAGEVAAQALYHGQALVAQDPALRDFLLTAAAEEGDHLDWCRTRLESLGGRTSLLNPLWFGGSVAIGMLAGLCGDRVSLGFIAETERQVEGHLDEHLGKLPNDDHASRAVLEQMKADEIRHGAHALDRGGQALPAPINALMRLTSKVMTASARWI